MTVRQILESKGREVVTHHPNATLEEITKILSQKRIGAIVLMDGDGRVAGIISERDVVRVIGSTGVSAMSQPVREIMTMKVRTCDEATSVNQAMEMMTLGRFRHLPVCEDGQLVGLISIGDVVKRRIDDAEREARDMREYITAG